MEVPNLDQMRSMSDADLLRLKTTLTYDLSVIDMQFATIENPDEDWHRRANAARIIYQRGLSTIKNILVERGADHKSERKMPLAIWMRALNNVAESARTLLDDDSDTAWANLEEAVENLDSYMAEYGLAMEVVT